MVKIDFGFLLPSLAQTAHFLAFASFKGTGNHCMLKIQAFNSTLYASG